MKPVPFTSRIERLDGGNNFHVLPVWEEVAMPLIEAGHRRVIVKIGGKEARRGIVGPEMGRYLIFGRPLLKEFGLRLGDTVEATIRQDPNPDEIELTPEFEAVLEQDDEARERWETFAAGKQRSLAHYLTSAKRPETRLKQAVEVAEKMRTYTLHGDTPPAKDRDS